MRDFALILALLASPAWGQITSSVEYGKAIHLADGAVVAGDFLIVPDGGSVDPIPVARITFSGLDGFPADAITVEGETQNWGVAEVYETHATETGREYLVFERGKIRVELQAIAENPLRFARERVMIEIPADDDSDDGDQDQDEDQDDGDNSHAIHAEYLIWIEEQADRGRFPRELAIATDVAIRAEMADQGLRVRIYDDDQNDVQRFVGYAGNIRPALIVYQDADNHRVFPAPKTKAELEKIVRENVIR